MCAVFHYYLETLGTLSSLWCFEVDGYCQCVDTQIMTRSPIAVSVLKSSPVQSFCLNFRQLATGLVAKFLKTRQLATELVATSCNQSFKRPVQDC